MRESSSLLHHHKEQQKSLVRMSGPSLLPEEFLARFIHGRYNAHELSSFVTLLKSMHFTGTNSFQVFFGGLKVRSRCKFYETKRNKWFVSNLLENDLMIH